jgi:hypothetical protein
MEAQAQTGWYQQQWNAMNTAQMQTTGSGLISPGYAFLIGPSAYDNPIQPSMPTWYFGLDTATGVREARPTPGKVVEEPSREMLKRTAVEVQDLDLSNPRQKLAAEAEAVLGYTPLRKELRAPGTLRRALAKLEIAVLEEASVDQYKKQMVEHYATTGKMAMPTWRLTPLKKYTQPVPEFVLQKAVEIKRELPEAQFYVDQLAMDPFLIVSLEEIHDWSTNQPRKLDAETAAYVEAWAEPLFEATL